MSWLVAFALFLVISALYSLVTGRPSWMGLPRRKSAGAAVGVGLVILIAGAMMLPGTEPAPSGIVPLAEMNAAATTSPTPSASPTPRYVLLEECFDDGKSVQEGAATLVCTLDDEGALLWMGESESTTLLAQRAEEKRVEAKRVADEKVAVEKAQAQKAAEEKAAVEAAADAKTAADESARVAAEQAAQEAAQQQAPAIQPLVEAPAAVTYQNCTAVKNAGAAPLYRGQPGYSTKLDRDGDGIACEK